jgi:hypothetical protein
LKRGAIGEVHPAGAVLQFECNSVLLLLGQGLPAEELFLVLGIHRMVMMVRRRGRNSIGGIENQPPLQ